MRCRTDGNSLSTYLDVRIFHDFFPHAVSLVAGIAWLVGFSFWTFGLTTITVPARNPFIFRPPEVPVVTSTVHRISKTLPHLHPDDGPRNPSRAINGCRSRLR